MPSYYSVVQYVPDPVTGERINVGVLVFGGGTATQARFVENWSRVRAFGAEDIGFLRKFAREAEGLREEEIRRMADTWDSSVQLTKPAGSLLSPRDLLLDAANRYLRETPTPGRQYRDRYQAVSLARDRVRGAVEQLLGKKAVRLVKNDMQVFGPHGEHPFDVGAKNGRPYFAARALSFEGGESGARLRQIESTAYALQDVREADPDLPLAVVVLPPPEGNNQVFERAVQTFQRYGAEVVEEAELRSWATSMAEVVGQEWGAGKKPGG